MDWLFVERTSLIEPVNVASVNILEFHLGGGGLVLSDVAFSKFPKLFLVNLTYFAKQ